MTVSISNTANLRAEDTASGKKLRWVESKTSWYWYNPSGSGTDDDENIILPNSNIGRWYKQESKVPVDNILYQSYTTPQTINPTNGDGIVTRSTTGIIEVNLPASPLVGHTIRVIHNGSGLSNITRINRNGKPIRGNSTSNGLELYITYTEITLTYCDSTVGWIYLTNQTVRVQATYNTTFTYASDGDTNGFFYWLGTNEGAATFVDPTQPNGAIGAKVAVYNGTGTSVTALLERATTAATIAFNSGSGARGGVAFYLITNLNNAAREFRLTRLLLRNSTNGTLAQRNFAIEGLPAANALSTTDMLKLNGSPGWVSLGQFIGDTTMSTVNSSYASYTINGADFYPIYRIRAIGVDASGVEQLALGEVEFYGEVRY